MMSEIRHIDEVYAFLLPIPKVMNGHIADFPIPPYIEDSQAYWIMGETSPPGQQEPRGPAKISVMSKAQRIERMT